MKKLILIPIFLFMSACSKYDLDKKVVVIDGEIYELQHRFLETYLLHKISKSEIEKAKLIINKDAS